MNIDVLMPIYATPVKWAREAVQSIRDQRMDGVDDLTLVIVDDNNPAGELRDFIYEQAICKCKTIVIRSDQNKGISHALNIGLEMCTADVIVRMDADDIAHENLVSKHASFFNRFHDRNICGVQIKLFSEGRVWHSTHPREVNREFALQDPGFWFLNHPGVAYRRETVLALGGYGNTPCNLAEDYALWIKFLKAGYTIYNREEILMNYRVHEKSFSFAPDRKAPEWHEFLRNQKESLRYV